MGLSGYAEPRAPNGTLRPNRHYDLCACGGWKKNTSLLCHTCRTPRVPRRQARPCTACGKMTVAVRGVCRFCGDYRLCQRGLHQMTSDNRTKGRGCKQCHQDRKDARRLKRPAPPPPMAQREEMYLVGYTIRPEPLTHWRWYGCTGTG